jgi:N-formylglutamate amidohydrolase
MDTPPWSIKVGNTPLVTTAIHNGHTVREEIAHLFALNEADRLREEDPFTDQWVTIADTQVVVYHSRFEVDLNRPREKAVYLTPADAWGLQVWQDTPPSDVLARSLAQYDTFYAEMQAMFTDFTTRFGRFVVFDLHTYNHRRAGPGGPTADPAQNPEVNIGTGTMNRKQWAPLVERFMTDLQTFDYLGRHLDVRENVRFQGGHFARWIHQTFPGAACVLAIEFKKFFMDEWTGKPDELQLKTIRQALHATVPGVLESLEQL